MNKKLLAGLLVTVGVLTTFAPKASAYVDNYGRVFPGPKPGTRKVVKKKVVATKKVTTTTKKPVTTKK